MIVYKFGGASVKDSKSIKNILDIVLSANFDNLIIVISAMGKTTNALEKITNLAFNDKDFSQEILKLKDYHIEIAVNLVNNQEIINKINAIFDNIEDAIKKYKSRDFDFFYDQIVSFGEILSTTIISYYLNNEQLTNKYVDSRKIIITDDNYKNANINYKTTAENIKNLTTQNHKIIITQGFIGSTGNSATTLGREGSDYSAAVYAYFTNAESLTIWKDVDGILTADPRIFNDTVKLDKISYSEAIELAYFGAQVIHPKTIKPLENKNIPLFVKSFINSYSEGTKITKINEKIKLQPIFIIKENQVLLSISPKDFSFIVEQNLSNIFQILSDFKISANLFQHSAISFSICIDNSQKLKSLIETLNRNYKVKYNLNLQLATIRHYTSDAIDKIVNNKKILVQQKSRNTVRFVMQNK